ncbi:MAG TPA: hypothetical protein VFU02_07535, partial [Polyangiaceae bacterium]|nr:hypothetical protein [Polyangiaceae bacterium]
WSAAGFVALLCVALAAVALPHALHSGYGACTVIALLGMAGFLGWQAHPRHLTAHRLEQALTALSAAGPVVIQLTPRTAAGIGRAGLAYAAVARSEAAEVLLAHATEPASVLAVARYWQTRLGVPLLPGWGLTKGDVEALDAKRAVSLVRVSYAGPSQHGAAGSAIALVCSAIALLALAGSVAVFREHPAGVMSLVLLGVGVGLLAAFAVAARTDVMRIVVQDTVEVERRCLRFRLGGIRLPLDEVRLLAVVSPDGKHGRHLVLASSNGFWAIECPAQIEPTARDPVVPIRAALGDAPPQRGERAPRIVSGSRVH